MFKRALPKFSLHSENKEEKHEQKSSSFVSEKANEDKMEQQSCDSAFDCLRTIRNRLTSN
jgi:hypothetical protein